MIIAFLVDDTALVNAKPKTKKKPEINPAKDFIARNIKVRVLHLH